MKNPETGNLFLCNIQNKSHKNKTARIIAARHRPIPPKKNSVAVIITTTL